jgi:hypothetical protein
LKSISSVPGQGNADLFAGDRVPVTGKTGGNNGTANPAQSIMQRSFSDLEYATKKKLRP